MIDTKTVPITIGKRAKRSQSALTFGSTRMQRYSKSRRFTYSQHGPERCLQFIKNTNWGCKSQKSQSSKINVVPNYIIPMQKS